MRSVIWLVLLAVVAVVAATTLGSNDGLVTIYWAGWRTELSLNLFLLLVLGACALIFSAAQALRSLLTLPERASEWRALRRERAAQAALRESLAEHFAARYSRSHKAAERALALRGESPHVASDAEFAVLANLLSAANLHRLQDRTRRDAAVAQALAGSAGAQGHGAVDGARLLAAEWALDDRDAARAEELLEQLPAGVSRRTQALRLRLQAARLARRPLEALQTARLLAKHQGFTAGAARSLLRSLAAEALDDTHDADQLRRVWGQLDAADRRDAMVAARAAARAVALGTAGDARAWLAPFWERLHELAADERHAVALAFFDAVPGVEPDWLPRLETALGRAVPDVAVQAATGMAFADRRLWGKARQLLEPAAHDTALPALQRRRVLRVLAQMARDAGDDPRAQSLDRQAAALE